MFGHCNKSFKDLEKQRIEKQLGEFCLNRVPPHARNQVRLFYTIQNNEVVVIESRQHFQDHEKWSEMPIAKLRYDQDSLNWFLFWFRENGNWELYPDFEPTKNLMKIVDEIEEDPYHVFWG